MTPDILVIKNSCRAPQEGRPDINVVCERLTVGGLPTRFEDQARLPVRGSCQLYDVLLHCLLEPCSHCRPLDLIEMWDINSAASHVHICLHAGLLVRHPATPMQ